MSDIKGEKIEKIQGQGLSFEKKCQYLKIEEDKELLECIEGEKLSKYRKQRKVII